MSESAFLQAICEDPENDELRLVFADWLEERGNPRGEFIRLQCELARLPEDDERRPKLLGWEQHLLNHYSKGWAGPLRTWVKRWEFRRGFIERVKLSASDFLQHGEELFQHTPLRHVHLTGVAEQAHKLAEFPLLKKISGLSITEPEGAAYPGTQAKIGTNALQTLLHSPHLDGLRTLEAQQLALGGAGADMLAACPRLQQLEALDLRNNSFYQGKLTKLFQSPSLKSMRRLRLGTSIIAPQELAPLIGQLEFLDLGWCGLQPIALRMVAEQKRCIPLKVLLLSGNPMPEYQLTTLFRDWLASPVLTSLHTLDLSYCSLVANAVKTIASSSNLSGLVHLGLSNNPLFWEGANSLGGSPYLQRLQRLDLCGSPLTFLGDRGVEELAKGSGLPRLAALDLRRNLITAKGAEALAKSSLSDRLYWLDLSGNHVGDDGAVALLKAEWPRLTWLNLRRDKFSPAIKQKLRTRFGYTVRY